MLFQAQANAIVKHTDYAIGGFNQEIGDVKPR